MLIHNAEITGSLLVNGIPYNTGSFSGSFTGTIEGVSATASYVEYTNVANKPTLVSGSSQVTYSGLTGIPVGIVSGSSQVTYSGLTGVPSGIVSGSAQVSFNGIVDKPTLVSGSAQVVYSGLTGVPSGIVSGSSQIAYSGLTGIPSGIVSGSTQIAGLGYATTSSNTFIGNQTITGSIFGTGSLTIDGNITSTGQIVAQTINVQQVTSSIVYSCGSNIFGTSLSNTQQFTGSMFITGSNLNANVGNACFQGSVCASSFIGDVQSSILCSNTINLSGNNNALACNNTLRFTDTDTATEGNQQIGKIEFFSCDVSAPGAGVKAYIGAFAQDTTPDAYIAFATQDGSGTPNPVERLRISSEGNIGIGTNNPSNLLHVCGIDGNSYIRWTSDIATTGTRIGYNGTEFRIDQQQNADITLRTNGNERLRISSTGIACFACQVCAPSFVGGTLSGTSATITNSGTACTVTDVLTLSNTQSGGSSVCAGAGILFTGNLGATAARIYSRGNMNFNNGSDLVFQTQASSGALQCTMVINGNNQNVGIGTFTPTDKLDIHGNDTHGAIVVRGGSSQTGRNVYLFSGGINSTGTLLGVTRCVNQFIYANNSRLTIGTGDVHNLGFSTSDTLRAIIDSSGIACFACQVCAPVAIFSGCVGIGTTSPQSSIDVISPTNGYVSFGRNISVGQWTGIHFGYREDNTNYRKSAIVFERTGGAAQGNIHFLNNNAADITSASLSDSRMVITSCGNVVIGNTVASNVGLTIYGTNAATIYQTPNTGTGAANGFYVGHTGDVSYVWNYNSFPLVLATSNTERMRITAGGIACFACQVCAPSIVFCNNVNSGYTALTICNPNAGSSAFSQISIFNNTANQAGLFYNSSARTDDGGACSFSMYNDSANGNIRIRTGNSIALATGSPATNRLFIDNGGVSCFIGTVCAPRFIGALTGNMNGFPILTTTSCLLGGGSSDVTIYFTSGANISYGVNDYTVAAYRDENAAVFSSLRALIPYNFYQSSVTTTNLASFLDSAHSHTVLSVAICKLVSSNTNCVAVRFAVSSGGVTGIRIQLTANGIQQGFS